MCHNGGQCRGGYYPSCACPSGYQGPQCQYGESLCTLLTALSCSLLPSLTHQPLTHLLTLSLACSLTHSIVCSLICSIAHSAGHSLVHSLIHLLTQSPICSITQLPTHSFTHLFTHSPICSLTCSFTHLLTHSLAHLLARSLTCSPTSCFPRKPCLLHPISIESCRFFHDNYVFFPSSYTPPHSRSLQP